MKFNIGDKVRFITDENNDDAQSFLSDLEADMQMDLGDRYLKGADYDRISEAIEKRMAWTVVSTCQEEGYELKLDGTDFTMQYKIDGQFLEVAP